MALLWKNLISAGQAFTLRVWLSLAAVAAFASLAFGQGPANTGLRQLLGTVAAVLFAWSLLLGPQLLRQDFRQDLLLADLLKTYPLRGWQLALGELLAPATIMTGVQWFLLILVLGLFSQTAANEFGWSRWVGMGFGVAILTPMLNLITLQIPNAAALLFPAWFQSTKGGGQGIEVMGQRLIFMLGQFVVFLVVLIPSAALFTGVFFLVKFLLGMTAAIPLASIAAASVLALEAGLGVILLGWLFERFDVSGELNG
jgi:fumarate reductase subunit C